GYLDVLGGGALMLNNGDLTFTELTITAYNGPVGDLNNDGSLDIVNYGTVMMNDGNENNYLKVYLTGTQSNRNGIGARVQVNSALGTQIRDVKAGDGFEYMSSITAHFGLGAETEVSEVVVYWPSGIVQTVTDPDINGTLNIIEGVSTSVTERSMSSELTLFPNPALDVLNITSDQDLSNRIVSILDVTGKCVLRTTLRHGQVDITALNSGLYMLQVPGDDGMLQRKFTKQ
ncbi:MAG TPA: ASPIC/UnbV domain-containing protein, partial [Flavobacteriales bacterium]|nr:ASPIC/UnbV domain-containing protein [Flavobacteriales bacterium]